ncbi:MAG: DUF3786 domain-containing protein [Endomicrobiia bacterium]
MVYETAKKLSFEKIYSLLYETSSTEKDFVIKLLADTYKINLETQNVYSLSCNILVPDYLTVLILHYLIKKLSGLPKITNEWINFRQLDGGEGYFPVFYNRVIEVIKRKYGNNPKNILNLSSRFNVKKTNINDTSVIIETFESVPILLILWPAGMEFSTEANLLFDSSIKNIFATEDIVVLSEFLAKSI